MRYEYMILNVIQFVSDQMRNGNTKGRNEIILDELNRLGGLGWKFQADDRIEILLGTRKSSDAYDGSEAA